MKTKRNVTSFLGAAVITLVTMSYSSTANETTAKADQDLLNEIASRCMAEAKEDQVAKEELIDYLALCINDELELNNFKTLTREEIVKLVKQSQKS